MQVIYLISFIFLTTACSTTAQKNTFVARENYNNQNVRAPANSEKSQKCEINLEAKSTNGFGTIVLGKYPAVLTMSSEECFKRALDFALAVGDQEGTDVDTSNFKTKGSTIYWRKIISWNFNDSLVWSSSGKVTARSAECMAKLNDSKITGDKLYWKGCEVF